MKTKVIDQLIVNQNQDLFNYIVEYYNCLHKELLAKKAKFKWLHEFSENPLIMVSYEDIPVRNLGTLRQILKKAKSNFNSTMQEVLSLAGPDTKINIKEVQEFLVNIQKAIEINIIWDNGNCRSVRPVAALIRQVIDLAVKKQKFSHDMIQQLGEYSKVRKCIEEDITINKLLIERHVH